ncbi:hypothetical protein FH972_008648 [Carpinus fangiana]|uniref:Uncharacterized protein n=1 Tax=Carpinus fangiana TaxID=176857 RepID=A0A5N6QZC7_9ROSI|nr:hypothetical protein FH972_008648 [Carpinus fangiana]
MAGKINAVCQAVEDDTLKDKMRTYMSGMTNWVTSEPTLAHPAATLLARPTMQSENTELIQNWLVMKFASQKPTIKWTRMKVFGDETIHIESIAGAVKRDSMAEATRGPIWSHMGPMARSSWMTETRGGMEKVEKKHEKRENHARWKARMWGGAIENVRRANSFLRAVRRVCECMKVVDSRSYAEVVKEASVELGVQARDLDKYIQNCKKASPLARFGDGLMVEVKKSLAPAKKTQDIANEEKCLELSGVEVSHRTLAGRLESDGDGQPYWSACLELQAIKRMLTKLKDKVEVGIKRVEVVVLSMEPCGLAWALWKK